MCVSHCALSVSVLRCVRADHVCLPACVSVDVQVGTSQLLDLLAKHGEFMNDSELAKILGTLLGGRSVADVLSTTTTPDAFTTGVLGF